MNLAFELNGRQLTCEIAPGARLLTVLRDLRQFSVKRGCETGDCGSCTVLLGAQPVNSCVVPAAKVRGQRVTTLEGLLGDPLMIRLQEGFVAASAVQCGYCTPGLLISLYAHLKAGGGPDEHALRECLSGNLCRCTGYVKPLAAAAAVARQAVGGGVR